MDKHLRIALAQLNFKVGAIDENVKKHLVAVKYAQEELEADLIVFPELSITGYPPEDLLLRQDFLKDAANGLKQLIDTVKNIYCIVGHPLQEGKKLFNACSVIHNEKIISQHVKHHLPNYDIFDECRYFASGRKTCVVNICGLSVGIIICEDIWFANPIKNSVNKGAKIIIVPNASPFETDKHERRLAKLGKRAKQNNVPIVYVNLVGGQDEITFDGGSLVIGKDGKLDYFNDFFTEKITAITFNSSGALTAPALYSPVLSKLQRIYDCLVLATRDYIEKNNFPGVLIGLSGGIDSALTLTIATDALGEERVQAILMPSRYSADISKADAVELANNLNVPYTVIDIEKAFQSFLNSLASLFLDRPIDITEENIQSRSRAVILMALSNKFGKLVLTTGNRSELAVGYCTLYGDMAGGFSILKDIPKTLVYELAKYRNTISPVIPQRTISRPPSAELAPNQLDQDTLPPYPILDKILEYYLNQELSLEEIVKKGFDESLVSTIMGLVRKAEYKRRQSAIGPRINLKSFGKDRRYPITNGFKG